MLDPKFDNSNTIFINILNKEDLFPIFRALLGEGEYRPHMTIAEALSNQQFYYAWNHFQHKEYRNQFFCDHVLVLGKPENSKGRWEKLERIPLRRKRD